MKSAYAIDTNVPIVANGKTSQAGSDCVAACVGMLKKLQRKGKVLLDENGFILQEYRRHLSPSGQPGLGDEFFKWLWDNQGNTRYCIRVAITALDDDGCEFAEFPGDPALASFDPSDKKFVAVTLAYKKNAEIINASDTDWWIYQGPLKDHGITVRFLCPELMTDN